MLKIEWQEYLAVGVAEIDAQHRQLFDRFNEFLAAYEEDRGGDEIARLLTFLDSYVATHFADEERFQQQIGFPDFLKHREVHQEFIGRISGLKERLRKEGASRSLISSASIAMTGWLIEHISRMDRAVGRFAREQGKEMPPGA